MNRPCAPPPASAAAPTPAPTPEQHDVPETISLSPLPEEAFAAYAPYDLKYEDGVLRLGWSAVRCFTDTGLSGYAPGAYLQNFHGNTDVFAIRDEYGTLTGLNWSFPGLDIYDACTQVIARAYAAEGLPTPTPLPERTPEPTPTAAFLAPLPEELAAYAPYGLTANEDGTLTYLGSSVRFLIDEAAGVELRWDTGGAGVYAAPEDANAAYNWNGRDELSTATGTVPVTLYEPYGLGMYDGRLYYGAEGVRSFLDEALGVEEYSHLPTATLDLRAVRDANGELTGLRVATAAESAAIAGDLYEYEAPPQQGGPLGSVEAAEDWY